MSTEVKSQVRAGLEPGGPSWSLERRKSERGRIECSNSVQKFGMNNNITCSVALTPPNNPCGERFGDEETSSRRQVTSQYLRGSES